VHYESRPLGHTKIETTARYTQVATGLITSIESPLDRLDAAGAEEGQAEVAGATDGPSRFGGRGYLPRLRSCVA